MAHRHPADLVSDERRLTVQDGRDPEAAGDETPVISQGAPEVTGTDDHDRPALREAKGPGDLVHEVFNVIADAPDPVRAQVGQVLAELGRVHAGGGGQRLAGDRARAALGQGVERPQVDR